MRRIWDGGSHAKVVNTSGFNFELVMPVIFLVMYLVISKTEGLAGSVERSEKMPFSTIFRQFWLVFESYICYTVYILIKRMQRTFET